MIEKPVGYDESGWAGSSYSKYPVAGPYVMAIKNSILGETRESKLKSLILYLDVHEGEYKDFYLKKYEESGDWKLKHRQLIEGYNGNSIPYFKGLIKAIEESNKGYIWDWNEKTLIKKLVGCMLREEEYLKKNGEIGIVCKPSFFAPIDKIMTLNCPPRKTLSYNGGKNNDGHITESDVAPPHTDNDLPF